LPSSWRHLGTNSPGNKNDRLISKRPFYIWGVNENARILSRIVVLLAVFGVRMTPNSSKQGSSSAAKSTESKPRQAEATTPPVWKALCQLDPDYGADPDIDEKLLSIPAGHLDPDCLRKSYSTEDWIRPVVATIADPVRTNLGLGSDRTIETIQAAAANAGYVPYLQGLGWRIASNASNSGSSSTDQRARGSQGNDSKNKTDDLYPGVLIFQASEESPRRFHPRYLAVFLVSETPTSGIDKEQFLSALRIIGNIPRKSKPQKGNPRTVLVAGPNFSGSVPSLLDLAGTLSRPEGLNSFAKTADPVRCLHAFSGSITNASFKPPPDSVCQLKLDNVQTDDRTALCAFRSWAAGIGFPDDQIAILSEEGTQYGRQGGDEEKKEDDKSSRKACNLPDHTLHLYFPRGIAALRNATEPGQDSGAGITASSGPQRLPMRWQDSESQSDEVPLYGAYQTSLSEETVLASLANTVKNENIKTLGILASDPWDVDFLIHWFTEAAPNVRLFVRDVDLLYLRTPDIGSVTGILAVSNYPLISENQFWSIDQPYHDDRDLLTFPSSTQEAQYNAFITLIEQLDPPIVDRPLRHLEDREPAQQNADPADARHLWLAATGTSGYLPIKPLWTEEAGFANLRGGLHSLNVGKPPYAAIILWFLIALVAVTHAIGVLIATPFRRKACETEDEPAKPRSAFPCFLTFDVGDPQDPVAPSKFICHAVGLSAAALATLVSGASFVFFWKCTLRSSHAGTANFIFSIYQYRILAGLVLFVTFFVVAVAGVCLYAGVWTCWARSKKLNPTEPEHRELLKLAFCGSGFALIPLGGIIFWLRLVGVANFDHAFMHFRDLRLGSGLAPVLPILFLIAVYYSGIWVYLRRVSRWEYGSAKMPTALDDVFPSNCNQQVDRVTCALLRFPEAPWGWIFLACFIGGLLLFRPLGTMDMLEPWPVQWFTLACSCFALLVLWSNWLRFLYIWQQMHLFLRILEKLPMRAAFSRISTQSTLSIWGWNVAPGKLLPLREAIEALRGLHRLSGDTFVTASARKKLLSTTRAFLVATSSSSSDVTELAEELTDHQLSAQAKSENSQGEIETLAYEGETRIAIGAERGAASGKKTLTLHTNVKEFNERVSFTTAAPSSNNGNRAPKPAFSTARRVSLRELKWLYHETREAMTEVIHQLIPQLYVYWHRGEVWPANSPIPLDRPRRKTDSNDQRYELAEELVALRFYSYIRYIGTELRHLLMFVILAFSGLFVALHSYSFRASRAIDIALMTLFLFLALGIILTFDQQERDALLSRLQRSTAGELGTNFYLDVFKYAALPALALIASQVPSISNFFLRWIRPGLDAFH